MSRFMPALSAALLAAHAAQAGNVIEPARLEIKANFHAASVYVHFRGDDNRSARAELTYRAGANEALRRGHALARTGPGRFAGSIFGLQPGQALDVRVHFTDPDAPTGGVADLAAALQTRSDHFPAGSGKTCYVGPAGNDGAPGTRQRPFGTIQHAADVAAPGDTIVLLAGTYFESVKVRRSGRLDAYITLRADRAASPVGRPAPAAGPRHAPVEVAGYAEINGPWAPAGGGTFAAAEKRTVGTLCGPKQRLYHHDSLSALKAAEGPLAAGWWQDAEAGRLYVRPADGQAPKAGQVRAGVLPFGLEFEQCGWWIVEDLTFHLFGGGRYSRGVGMDNAWNIVVRHCRFDTMRTGILLRKVKSRDCLIERCELLDNGIWTWPWKRSPSPIHRAWSLEACKGHDVEGAGISLRGGEGNVVRHNRVRGPFNGIAASTWGDLKEVSNPVTSGLEPRNESLNRDMDVHHNTFTEIGDDPMEPEGACMNVRFWANRTRHTLQGISLAPITVGPVFVVRDRYLDYKAGAVKVSVQSSGVVWVYHAEAPIPM